MFSQSGTQTPVPSSQHGNQLQKIQFHEVLGESITWVNDWYLPNLCNNSNQLDSTISNIPTANTTTTTTTSSSSLNQTGLDDDIGTPAISDLIILKGWHKTNINHKQSNNILNPNDILDLSKWKYFKIPVIEEPENTTNGSENEIKKVEQTGGVLGEVIKF